MSSNDVDNDGRHDFDWIYGRWKVLNRRRARVADPKCDEWVEFDGHSFVYPALDGLGHVDFLSCEQLPDGARLHGMTVRLFDPATRTWTIYWTSSRQPGALDVPVVGQFTGRHGVFETDDVIDERPTRVRYEWMAEDEDAPRWQQSFSLDGGMNWRSNWQMTLSRAEAAA
jgi:hypothetical protein